MSSITSEKRQADDERVARDIREYGCHVICVFDPEEKELTFSYSVGIQETTGAPEAIVVGPRPQLGQFMINEYLRQLRSGVRFERGVKHDGFLEGFAVYIEPAREKNFAQYTFGCQRYYEHHPLQAAPKTASKAAYEVVQIVYPTTSGIWPWDKAASAWFKHMQPMLGRLRPGRP